MDQINLLSDKILQEKEMSKKWKDELDKTKLNLDTCANDSQQAIKKLQDDHLQKIAELSEEYNSKINKEAQIYKSQIKDLETKL